MYGSLGPQEETAGMAPKIPKAMKEPLVVTEPKKTRSTRPRPGVKRSSAVFRRVFESQPPPSERSILSKKTSHSGLYIMLNPRSNQKIAVTFKAFIVSVISVDLVFFILSTEPNFRGNMIFLYAEGVTSSIFLLEYIARLIVVSESRTYADMGPIIGRLAYSVTSAAVIDALATFPFFIELATGLNLPTMTYLRVFRLLRILKTQAYARAFDALWRVFFYNREILQVAGWVCLFLILFTAVLMYYLRPPGEAGEDFNSIPNTMYIATLMLTGQGGPDADNMPWYTKAVILLTGAFSVAVFAIPASMLTWGFEAEAERLAAASRRRKKSGDGVSRGDSSTSSEWDSSDSNTTDEEYEKIISGDGDEPTEDEKIQQLMKVFASADTDVSGSLNAQEFVDYLKNNVDAVNDLIGGGSVGRGRGPHDREIRQRVSRLEEKVDAIDFKLDQLLSAVARNASPAESARRT
jgi:voltage-gated potassium channel